MMMMMMMMSYATTVNRYRSICDVDMLPSSPVFVPHISCMQTVHAGEMPINTRDSLLLPDARRLFTFFWPRRTEQSRAPSWNHCHASRLACATGWSKTRQSTFHSTPLSTVLHRQMPHWPLLNTLPNTAEFPAFTRHLSTHSKPL